MFGAIAGGIASALAGGAMSKLFGGGQKAASGGIQGDVLATDNKDRKSGSAGMPRPTSYAVFCLKKKDSTASMAAGSPSKSGVKTSIEAHVRPPTARMQRRKCSAPRAARAWRVRMV